MNLVVAMTGASGAVATKLLVERSKWPVTLVASEIGKKVYEQECEPFDALATKVAEVFDCFDMMAPIASGSVLTAGMVVLPCSVNSLGKIASGISDSLITRAAHCHLKEGRKLILCVREAPWTLINIRCAEQVAASGGTIMPISPPFYMLTERDPSTVSVEVLLEAYIDRVLSLLGQPSDRTWESVR